jgi:hypothetical protein
MQRLTTLSILNVFHLTSSDFLADLPEGFGKDFGHPSAVEQIENYVEVLAGAGSRRMDDAEFAKRKASMSPEQRAIFDEVQTFVKEQRRAKGKLTSLRMFLTGGAGVGKSFLTEKNRELLERAHRGLNGQSAVLVTAPTGVAAFNIQEKRSTPP